MNAIGRRMNLCVNCTFKPMIACSREIQSIATITPAKTATSGTNHAPNLYRDQTALANQLQIQKKTI